MALKKLNPIPKQNWKEHFEQPEVVIQYSKTNVDS